MSIVRLPTTEPARTSPRARARAPRDPRAPKKTRLRNKPRTPGRRRARPACATQGVGQAATSPQTWCKPPASVHNVRTPLLRCQGGQKGMRNEALLSSSEAIRCTTAMSICCAKSAPVGKKLSAREQES